MHIQFGTESQYTTGVYMFIFWVHSVHNMTKVTATFSAGIGMLV